MTTADDIIAKLELEPLNNEGGHFKQLYYSKHPAKQSNRVTMSNAYYLLSGNEYSCWHRLKSDEAWFYLHGGPVTIYEIIDNQLHTTHTRREQVIKSVLYLNKIALLGSSAILIRRRHRS